MPTTAVPLIQGWFTTGEQPALLGRRCRFCGATAFPPTLRWCPNPACNSDDLELDRYEDIGLCAEGEGEKLLADGATAIGGRIPVNTSGGLACFGEAVPAQALAQVCEITWQLRGQAGARQVEGAKAGITANQGLFGHGSSVLLSR